MSTAYRTLPLEEVMRRELSRYQNLTVEGEKREVEKLRRERDFLKREVEELRSKMMESRETAQFYRTTLHDLEQRVLKANASLAISTGRTGFSTTGRAAVDRSVFGTKETYISGFSQSKPENQGKSPEAGDENSSRSMSLRTTILSIFLFHLGYAPYQLIRLCDLMVINQIKKNLHEENLERFEQSCFGHFLKMNHIEYQGHVVLHLLMHMDMAASSKERLVFRINNTVVEFGPKDFSLITGLRLGTTNSMMDKSYPSYSSSVQKDIFKNSPTIFMKTLKNAFLNVSRANKGRGESTLKLAMLYFLYGTLLAVHPLKRFDLKYFDLVEDLQKFNTYPWGQVAYEFFASFMLSSRCLVDSAKVCQTKTCLFVQGFSFALQIWAYEVMPFLAQYCAVRVNNFVNLTPRILRWSALKKKVHFERLKVFFAMNDDKEPWVLHGIQASPAEMEKRTRETIRQPKNEETSLLSEKDQSNENEAKLLEGRCSSSAAAGDDVIVISDNDDDDYIQNAKRKRGEETQAATSIFDSTDSDDDSCSDSFMENYVASIQSRTTRK